MGRLTKITDYDDSDLDYFYDDAGQVTKMTDYHNNDTTYTYTDTGQISTITAPGSKVWTWTYNAAGAPTQYTHPNGMTTEYAYDDDGRQTKITHKDGVNVVQSFEYATDPVGNITKTTHEDGSWWEYEYDGRNRLTTADRHNKATPTITAAYAYTYDDGDNMLTKVMPFEDDFNDGNYTGWSTVGSWSASNYYMENTDTTPPQSFYRNASGDDFELRFQYEIVDNQASTPSSHTQFRLDTATGERLAVDFKTDQAVLREYDGSAWNTLDTDTAADTALDTLYDVRIVADGANVEVWWGEPGEMPEKILETSSAPLYSGTRVRWYAQGGGALRYDNIRLIGTDLDVTTTYSYNNGNELTSMADYNGTISFAYDAWGRQTSKTRGSHAADFTWGYGSKLIQADSGFPGQGTVDYRYGGDQKRRERDVTGGEYTWYNWDIGWNVLNEETEGAGTGNGALAKTFALALSVGGPGASTGSPSNGTLIKLAPSAMVLSEVAGNSPATGDYSYYMQDNIQSVRAAYDGTKNAVGDFEYTPYGVGLTANGAADLVTRFAGLENGATTGLAFAPYRYYSPDTARWLSRDPLGSIDGPNVYTYVLGNPNNLTDPLGLSFAWRCKLKTGFFCPWGYWRQFTDGCGRKWCCKKTKNQDRKCDKCWEKFGKAVRKCKGVFDRKACIDRATVKLTACLQKNGCI